MRHLIAASISVICLSLAFILVTPQSNLTGQININNAQQPELLLLPGIDREIAQNIMDFRQSNGPFNQIDDLTKINGISPQLLTQIRPLLTSEGETTLVQINSSNNPFRYILNDAYSTSFMRCLHRPIVP